MIAVAAFMTTMNFFRLGGKVGDRERLRREHEAGQECRPLVTTTSSCASRLCGIRRAGGILADERIFLPATVSPCCFMYS